MQCAFCPGKMHQTFSQSENAESQVRGASNAAAFGALWSRRLQTLHRARASVHFARAKCIRHARCDEHAECRERDRQLCWRDFGTTDSTLLSGPLVVATTSRKCQNSPKRSEAECRERDLNPRTADRQDGPDRPRLYFPWTLFSPSETGGEKRVL